MELAPGIPRGTRDFGPGESLRRNFILQTLEGVFQRYGFVPLQTPAMENLETLIGKYGEEGDQLLFKILNSGLHDQKNKETLREHFLLSLEKPFHSRELTDKALRYDLTVPLARYVCMHRHELSFPFRRYQIQPVWRADRPQKGRYREFVQCDVDIIGTSSLLSEWELIGLTADAFSALHIPAELRWNHRKMLQALAEYAGCPERFSEFTLCLDKWDKNGKEGVEEALRKRNFSESAISKTLNGIQWLQEHAQRICSENPPPHEMLDNIHGQHTLKDIRFIYRMLEKGPLTSLAFRPDFTLARGLNYYTGFIFEVKAMVPGFQPSISGGGRYDDLTGIFGQPGLSGAGISFGLDRIYDVMEMMNLFPEHLKKIPLAFCMGLYLNESSPEYLHPVLHQLRKNCIPSFQFPEPKKIARQFEYADKNGIPLVMIAGEEEIKNNGAQLKNLKTGTQKFYSLSELIQTIQHEYEHFQSG